MRSPRLPSRACRPGARWQGRDAAALGRPAISADVQDFYGSEEGEWLRVNPEASGHAGALEAVAAGAGCDRGAEGEQGRERGQAAGQGGGGVHADEQGAAGVAEFPADLGGARGLAEPALGRGRGRRSRAG